MNAKDIEAIRARRTNQYRDCVLEHEHEDISHLLYHVDELRAALTVAAEHFDAIAAKAENWRATFANNELAEARWAGIRNHARTGGRPARRALGDQSEPLGL